ncbi:MAG: hypothetical protein RR860_01990, partial [Janthinobacterium sp.]
PPHGRHAENARGARLFVGAQQQPCQAATSHSARQGQRCEVFAGDHRAPAQVDFVMQGIAHDGLLYKNFYDVSL